MRISISGTHGAGKSTLIDVFLCHHDDYSAEPEAYEALQELGEAFSAEPSAEELFRQLEYHAERLREYSAGDRVVFERCPADYVAYLLALEDLSRETADAGLTERAIEVAREALPQLDLVVYLPEGEEGGPEAEDPQLGAAVDARLAEILIDDDLGFLQEGAPRVIEAAGNTVERLRALELARQTGTRSAKHEGEERVEE